MKAPVGTPSDSTSASKPQGRASVADVLRRVRLLEGRAAILDHLANSGLSPFVGEEVHVPAELLIAHGEMGGAPAPFDAIEAVRSDLLGSAEECRRIAAEVMSAVVQIELPPAENLGDAEEDANEVTSFRGSVVANEWSAARSRNKKPRAE